MRWYEITVHTTEAAEEMISNFIHELGAGGVSIEESGTLNKKRDTSLGQWYDLPLNDIPEGRVVIKGYFPEGSEVESIYEQLQVLVTGLSEFDIDTGNAAYEMKEVDEEDWANAWKQYFKPIRITDKLTIKPTWEEYEPTEGEVIIELDPGMAFGTGTHETTALCLRTIESILKPGDEVIDVGTGSGVLAIAAALLGARHVLAIDLDPVAVSVANENVRVNSQEAKVSVRYGDLLQVLQTGEMLGVTPPVDVVVANILAEILLLFMADVYQALKPGGMYIASGIIESKQANVEKGLIEAGFTVVERHRDKDWVAIVARKG